MAGSNHFFTVSVSEAVTSEFLDTPYFRSQPSYCFESAAKRRWWSCLGRLRTPEVAFQYSGYSAATKTSR
jgi:hypothetical protein